MNRLAEVEDFVPISQGDAKFGGRQWRATGPLRTLSHRGTVTKPVRETVKETKQELKGRTDGQVGSCTQWTKLKIHRFVQMDGVRFKEL